MRERFAEAMKNAMRSKDVVGLSTLRLIQAAVHDRDIVNRGQSKGPITDEEIVGVLGKMVKQREESARVYDEASRPELAQRERQEIEVIKAFLPKQMGEDAVRHACAQAVEEVGAEGLRDIGKCMNALKAKYPGQMDFSKANGIVKGLLQ
jgi:uncharacterized protein YqeY